MEKTEHPVQLPDSLITKWLEDVDTPLSVQFQEAAEWGANVELEACCEWLSSKTTSERKIPELRAARRSKPPSLKEDALAALHGIDDQGPTPEQVVTIRLALEALPND